MGLLLVVRLRNGDTLEWIVLHEGWKKARDVSASLAFLYIFYSAFKASTTASKPVPLLDLIRTWSPSLSSAFKSAINASLSM